MTRKIIKPLYGLTVGQYGENVSLEIVDSDGNAFDLSAYTAFIIRAISKDAQETLSFTGSFTSASLGTGYITPSSTNTFGRDGSWTIQGQFSDTAAPSLSMTDPLIVIVDKKV